MSYANLYVLDMKRRTNEVKLADRFSILIGIVPVNLRIMILGYSIMMINHQACSLYRHCIHLQTHGHWD